MKAIDVEELLRWAYRHELPKRDVANSNGYNHDLSVLGIVVDSGSSDREPGFPVALGAPHPDALVVDHAVRGLEDWRMGIDNHTIAGLMGDIAGIVSDRHGIIQHLVVNPSAMLLPHARMGTRPIWDLGPISLHRDINPSNGKVRVQHIEDGRLKEGRTAGRHYGELARCPVRWEPDPVQMVVARAEYAAWYAGLIRVAEQLRAWGLREHAVKMPYVSAAPWFEGTQPKSRILEPVPNQKRDAGPTA